MVWAVARVTWQEILRDKILYNVGIFGVLLIGLAFLAARLSFIRPERILIDFGVAGMNLSFALMAILLGAQAVLREQERHTIWIALSHPIHRGHFIIGKFLGVLAVMTLNWFLNSALLLGALSTQVGSWDELWRPTLAIGLVLLLMQAGVFVALAFCLSTFMTFSMTTMIGAATFLIGNSMGQLRALAVQLKDQPVGYLLEAFNAVFLDLDRFNLGHRITYDLPLGWIFVTTSIFYAFFWSAAFLGLATWLLERRDA